MLRTRFAPSPTGFLHIGGARTALFSWAYAKKHAGQFILRIEDTDLERSTEASVNSIITAMDWLKLDYAEGPYFQTKRMARYKEVIEQLLSENKAYYCYCTKEELELMRETQKKQGLKPKYDRRCLSQQQQEHNIHKVNKPVVRFKNPDSGSVVWHDLVKGKIEINNAELDDLIIARSDGTPTYNFCVAVDDMDMHITQVIRGDDHVNNTPRQINILQALGATIPHYAHVPMILNASGHKMSKRTDAVSVMEYQEMGILPEALLNYLARLCWGHQDAEIFDINQFIAWFDLGHISPAAARFDMQKLLWVNAEHLKMKSDAALTQLVIARWQKLAADAYPSFMRLSEKINLATVINLVKPRANTLNVLTDECSYFYHPLPISAVDREKHLKAESLQLLEQFIGALRTLETTWTVECIHDLINTFCQTHNCKMPQLGMPLRLILCGTTRTPSLDALIHVLGLDTVLNRMQA